jgi:hypothetical protein
MIGQACTPMGFITVAAQTTSPQAFASVTVTATTTFVVPPGTNLALLVAESGAVRWRDDGVAPTPTAGMLMEPTQPPFEYSGDINAISFIAVSASATVDASLYKVAG